MPGALALWHARQFTKQQTECAPQNVPRLAGGKEDRAGGFKVKSQTVEREQH
jgi:hypothetical protein